MWKNEKRAEGAVAGKLNIFQRTMLQWNDAAAYNAVHVVRIARPLELDRLSQIIRKILERRGLTGMTMDRNRGTYQYHGGPAVCDIQTLPGTPTDRATLIAEVERQLNTAFVPGEGFQPFRFFVAPENECFSLGLAYFHAVADAESFVMLMKEIVETYQDRTGATPDRPVNLYPPSYDNLLRHRPALLARKLSTAPSLVWHMSTSSRPPYRNGAGPTNGFTLCTLEAEALHRLMAAAKSWGVTLNDLFLGLLMQSIGLVATDRTSARRRRRIAVGCIVNTRKDLGLDRGQIFGLFLGSFVVTHKVPERISLRELVGDLHRQTTLIKRHKLYVGAPLEMAFARFMLSVLSAERGKKLYHRYYPLWGGVTNMNLNPLWGQTPSDDGPADYFRAVSSSPATPLVLSATTVGKTLNLGFTFRSTAYSVAEIEQMKIHFLDQAACPEGHA